LIIYLAMSENPFQRAARAIKRPDYYALNDGSDSEAETDDRIMLLSWSGSSFPSPNHPPLL
jgi:hypothetical protein